MTVVLKATVRTALVIVKRETVVASHRQARDPQNVANVCENKSGSAPTPIPDHRSGPSG